MGYFYSPFKDKGPKIGWNDCQANWEAASIGVWGHGSCLIYGLDLVLISSVALDTSLLQVAYLFLYWRKALFLALLDEISVGHACVFHLSGKSKYAALFATRQAVLSGYKRHIYLNWILVLAFPSFEKLSKLLKLSVPHFPIQIMGVFTESTSQ